QGKLRTSDLPGDAGFGGLLGVPVEDSEAGAVHNHSTAPAAPHAGDPVADAARHRFSARRASAMGRHYGPAGVSVAPPSFNRASNARTSASGSPNAEVSNWAAARSRWT